MQNVLLPCETEHHHPNTRTLHADYALQEHNPKSNRSVPRKSFRLPGIFNRKPLMKKLILAAIAKKLELKLIVPSALLILNVHNLHKLNIFLIEI